MPKGITVRYPVAVHPRNLTGISQKDLKDKYHDGRRDFSRSLIQGANFWSSNFTDIDLSDSIITQTSFKDANMSRANFAGVDFRQVQFYGARLNGAVFSGAEIDGMAFGERTDWRGANLVGAIVRTTYGDGAPLPPVVVRDDMRSVARGLGRSERGLDGVRMDRFWSSVLMAQGVDVTAIHVEPTDGLTAMERLLPSP